MKIPPATALQGLGPARFQYRFKMLELNMLSELEPHGKGSCGCGSPKTCTCQEKQER